MFSIAMSSKPDACTMAEKSAYELEREERIRSNKLKIQELGLDAAAAELEALKPAKKPRLRKTKADVDVSLEARRSGRARKEVNYCEETVRVRSEKVPVDHTERIKGMSLDAETAERLRLEMEAKRGSGRTGKQRGPVDSGKGVRIQGGRVYDSKHGVTCHWCRQKTLEDHVTCTNPSCGHGKRMPLSFCAKCLKNRHGEDFETAEASGSWWCPACRGSCGPGCVICCNCGPCRKKAGLEPTHQVVKLARDAGFTNVHDYLVHLVTGESAEEIAARKLQHSWGAWLKTDSSDASEQTGCAGHHNCASGLQRQESDARQGEGEPAQCSQDAVAKDTRLTDYFPARKATSCRNTKAASKAKGAKGKAAEDLDVSGALLQSKASSQESVDTLTAADVPMLSSQDTKLSRKQRIMQRMGLAPVSIC